MTELEGRWRGNARIPTLLKIAVVLLLVAAALGIALGSLPFLSTPASPTVHTRVDVPDRSGNAGRSDNGPTPRRALPSRTASPSDVALRFVGGWLGCTYHRAPCTRASGMLPAYRTALQRAQSTSLATPAELSSRLRIIALQLTRSCGDDAVATATYQVAAGGRFQLHVNLVRERGGWRVFDVAEAPPHIPLPPPLNRGPRGC